MSILDNIANVDTFNPATPLAQANQLQAQQQNLRAEQFKQQQAVLGSEIRGLQPYVNTPEFAGKWAETADRLLKQGAIDPQQHAQWRNTPSPLLMKSIIAQTEDPALSFRRERAGVEDAHWAADNALRQRTAARLEDKTPEGFEKNPNAPGLRPVPGGPTDPAYIESTTRGKKNDFNQAIEDRKKAAVANGLDPSSPGFQSFVLTGKMPREDAQPLTATDKKAILEADEHVQATQQAIDNLKQAKLLSKQAFEGPMAGKRGYAASFLGESSDIGKGGIATTDLNNLVSTNALSQLKSIFGGNPTEGERAILLEIQGSVNQPDSVRQKIYDRGIALAEKRMAFNKQRADELRGGQFYKPQGSMQRAPVQQTQGITQEQFNALPSGSVFTAPDGSQRVKP